MIDIDELRDIVKREEQREFWRQHELEEKDIEIAKLKEKQENGPEHYRSDWRTTYHNIPMSDRVEISAMSHKSGSDQRFDDEIRHDLDVISASAITQLLGVFTFWIVISLMILL